MATIGVDAENDRRRQDRGLTISDQYEFFNVRVTRTRAKVVLQAFDLSNDKMAHVGKPRSLENSE